MLTFVKLNLMFKWHCLLVFVPSVKKFAIYFVTYI